MLCKNNHIRIWPILLCCYSFPNTVEPKRGLFGYWDKTYMEKDIFIRIVKKDWRPLGPSRETDDVMDEYKWDVQSAFHSLLHSHYEFEQFPLSSAEKIFQSDQYDKDLESIIIIHPIFAGADSNFVKTTINALAMRNVHKQYNIFAVDTNSINIHMLISIVKHTIGLDPNYNEVTEVLSSFLVAGIDGQFLRPDQIHLIGFSYSGHLVGYLGRFVSLHYQRKISSLLVLDPFTNGQNSNLIHVSSEDAQVVHVYHSNSIVGGSQRLYGTVDFIFNNGDIQPECYITARGLARLLPGAMACSHLRIVQRLWYIILYPSRFIARQCETWEDFTDCRCENHPTTNIMYPIKNRGVSGVYYIRTSGEKPYGLDSSGSSCAVKTEKT